MSRRPIVLSEVLSNAKYLVRATLRNQAGFKVSGVLCGVFLPERLTDPIKLRFHPTAKQVTGVQFARFKGRSAELSFRATVRHGGRRTTLSADRIWCSNTSSGHHDGISFVSDFTAEPSDFHIIHFGLGKGSPSGGTFFLTPNALINTAMTIIRSYTGSVKVRRICRPQFSLQSGVRLAFTEYFHYREGEHGETTSSPQLVAEFRTKTKAADIAAASKDLDDFLLLTSFATRHRCVCLGWTYTGPRGDIARHYRRDIVMPKEQKSSRENTLIDVPEFPEFIRAAYRSFCKFTEKDQFKSALYPLVSDLNITEILYFSLFSALESALLFADRNFQLLPKGRHRLHERWKLFQAKYTVDLSDLWPLTDGTMGITLTQLRNNVVHGEYLNPAQTFGLLYAQQHLRWTLERVILSLLGWSISRSKVSPRSLGHMHAYYHWQQGRAAF